MFSEKLYPAKLVYVGMECSLVEIDGKMFPHSVDNNDIKIIYDELLEQSIKEFADSQRLPDPKATEILEKHLWELV